MTTGTQDRTAAVVDAVCATARPLILAEYAADSCIASTRIAINALAYFSINATPLPVTVMALNPEAADLIESGGSLDSLAATLARHSPQDETGPWTVGVGYGGDTRAYRWAGHLVAAIPTARTIVDLSIDQVSRPVKDMRFEPLALHIADDAWWSGDPDAVAIARQQGLLMYRPIATDPDGYKASPNWADDKPSRRITGQVIRAVREHLDG